MIRALAFSILAQVDTVQLGAPPRGLSESDEVSHIGLGRTAVLHSGAVETLVLRAIKSMPLL